MWIDIVLSQEQVQIVERIHVVVEIVRDILHKIMTNPSLWIWEEHGLNYNNSSCYLCDRLRGLDIFHYSAKV